MGLFDFISGWRNRPAKVSKATRKKAEKFVVENIEHPVSQAYLKTYATGGPWPRKIRIKTLQQQGLGNLLNRQRNRRYPFVRSSR